MRIASIADIKAKFSAYIDETQRGPVVVTRDGAPVAVLLAMTDPDELERLLLSHSPRFRKIVDAARRQFQKGQGVSHEDFWRSVDDEKPRSPKRKRRTATSKRT
jgi:prevent-host-death family protein